MIALILGGTRSGKSATAEAIARSFSQPVTYIATAVVDPADNDHRARIAAHQARRSADWTTLECAKPADLVRHLRTVRGVALVDSLGTWVTLHRDVIIDPADLLDALEHRNDPTVIVSEEVGLAVHPPTEAGRWYVDIMGALNQRVAQVADRVFFVVAGRSIELTPANTEGPSQ